MTKVTLEEAMEALAEVTRELRLNREQAPLDLPRPKTVPPATVHEDKARELIERHKGTRK